MPNTAIPSLKQVKIESGYPARPKILPRIKMSKYNTRNKLDYSKVVELPKEISFYKDVTASIIKYLENDDTATFQEIIKYVDVGGSDRRTLRLLDQMVVAGLLIYERPYFKIYRSASKNQSHLRISNLRCKLCDSKLVNITGNKSTAKLVSFMKKIIKDRPLPTFVFDQRPVTAETAVRRVAYAQWRGDIQDKRIVIIGDDDLNSVALAKAGVAKEIVVFDVDDRILNYINKISRANKLKIKTVNYNLLKEIPPRFLNYFDVFMTDPTPTPKPLSLFVNWGLKMLSKQKGKVGYISLYPSHMEKDEKFQKILSRMDVLITDLIPFFNQYDFVPFTYSDSDNALLKKYASKESKISFWEYLMRVETVAKTRALDIKLSPLDMFGRATKRVLKDSSKDPVLNKKNSSRVIENTARDLKGLLGKRE